MNRQNRFAARLVQRIVFAVVLIGSVASAEEKPILVISLSGIDELLGDLTYCTETMGLGQTGQDWSSKAEHYVKGLDRNRPIGVIIRQNDDTITPIAVLPVTDLRQFLRGLEPQIGHTEDAGDGILELADPASMFLKEIDGWAFVAGSPDELVNLPSDPATILSQLAKGRDVAIQAFFQNIPESYRDMALDQIREGVQSGLDSLGSGDEADFQRKIVQQNLAQWEDVLTGLDKFTVRWDISEEKRNLLAHVSVEAVPNTEMDQKIRALRPAVSHFPGFIHNDAAVAINTSINLTSHDIDRAVLMVESSRKDIAKIIDGSNDIPQAATKATLKRLFNVIADVTQDTLKSGTFDAASSVALDNQEVHLISAMHVENATTLETAIKDLAQQLPPGPGNPKMELNVDQHAGVRFHRIMIPLSNDEDVRRVFGDSLQLTLGVAKENVYVGVGRNGQQMLYKAIDQSSSTPQGVAVDPVSSRISLASILRLATQFDDSDALVAAATALQKSPHDQVLNRMKVTDDGLEFELEVQEGVLAAVGEALHMSRIH